MGYDSMTSSRERKILLDEPAPGQDMVYDGAANMTSIAYLMDKQKERHTNGSSWVTPQNYSTPFKSKTPRPFQHNKFPITAQANKFPILGPGQYNLPVGEKESQHLFSASVSWQSRGRAGRSASPSTRVGDRRSSRARLVASGWRRRSAGVARWTPCRRTFSLSNLTFARRTRFATTFAASSRCARSTGTPSRRADDRAPCPASECAVRPQWC